MKRRETSKWKLLFGLPETCSHLEVAVQTPLRDCLWFVIDLFHNRVWQTQTADWKVNEAVNIVVKCFNRFPVPQFGVGNLFKLFRTMFISSAFVKHRVHNSGPLIYSYLHKWAFLVSLKVRILLYFAHANVVRKTNYQAVEPLGTDTSLMRTPPSVPRKFSFILFKKNLYNTYSLIRTTDTKSRLQRVNSYRPILFITDTAVIWCRSRIPNRWICTRWIPSGWWAMQGDFKNPVAVYQTTIWGGT